MHMSDALLSLPVAGAFLAISTAALAVSASQAAQDPRAQPARMGVLGAFVFAAQMVNFSIPGTGSSGHFAGGVLLALLIGPWAGALVIASVLAVQALFFADGGLLAWGANVFNMGLIGCFVAVPLVYRGLAGSAASPGRRRAAIMAASLTACVGGALAVTVETTASGLTDLPWGRFALLMIPVHAAIGVVEGLINIAVLEQLPAWAQAQGAPRPNEGRRIAGVGLAALLVAGTLSWFASARPDGLEHSVARMGALTASAPRSLNQRLSQWQARHALLPDYDFRPDPVAAAAPASLPPAPGPWPRVNGGTSVAGLGGAFVVALLALALGGLASWWSRRRAAA
jgi:cobalt/nickel transport system permease protein